MAELIYFITKRCELWPMKEKGEEEDKRLNYRGTVLYLMTNYNC